MARPSLLNNLILVSMVGSRSSYHFLFSRTQSNMLSKKAYSILNLTEELGNHACSNSMLVICIK